MSHSNPMDAIKAAFADEELSFERLTWKVEKIIRTHQRMPKSVDMSVQQMAKMWELLNKVEDIAQGVDVILSFSYQGKFPMLQCYELAHSLTSRFAKEKLEEEKAAGLKLYNESKARRKADQKKEAQQMGDGGFPAKDEVINVDPPVSNPFPELRKNYREAKEKCSRLEMEFTTANAKVQAIGAERADIQTKLQTVVERENALMIELTGATDALTQARKELRESETALQDARAAKRPKC
jgi:hypothetical protein